MSGLLKTSLANALKVFHAELWDVHKYFKDILNICIP